MKVLFLTPYPFGEAPSQRFRFEQYAGAMRKAGILCDFQSFISQETWNILYKPGNYIAKVAGMLGGFFRRMMSLFSLAQYDYVFIHREAAPLGPPVFEWLIAKVFSKKIIYDFDDAIWLPNVSESNRIFSKLKWYGKVRSICRWAHLVSCGNDYLKEYARQFNENVVVNPTVVDTENHYDKIKNHQPGKTVIGWTGTHSTIGYLNELQPVLQQLEKEGDIEIRIISDTPSRLDMKSLQFTRWKKSSEIEDLLALDIGIMPLTDDEWSRGKCGFKLIQYMALGIPAVSSPVGVNTKIINDGVNGFLCRSHEEWLQALRDLIAHPEKRSHFGKKGREQIQAGFSTVANSPLFLSMFA